MSERKIYLKNDIISLAECLPEDYHDFYDSWSDEEVQKGYNFKINKTFEEYIAEISILVNTAHRDTAILPII